jgi:hypothetical protein
MKDRNRVRVKSRREDIEDRAVRRFSTKRERERKREKERQK